MCVMDTSAQFDELYHAFDNIPSFEIRRSRLKLSETAWHLTPLSDRMVVTYEIITGAIDITYRELFCDFRSGGYRILGDIICDLDEMYRASGISDNLLRKDDSEELQMLLTGIDHYGDYKQILIRNCMTTVIFPKKYNGFTLQESYGLRTFWDSQQNQEIQKDEDWQKR